MGAITDQSRPWVTAHSTRPAASTAKLGASAEMSCETVKHARLSSNVLPARPVRGPAHQGNRRHGRHQGIPGQQCADQNHADLQVSRDADNAPTGSNSAVT